MESPLLYLTVCSIRNRLRVRLRRLREPRYLIGSVLGVSYFYWIFLGSRRRVRPSRAFASAASGSAAALQLAATALLFGFAALAWIWPSSRRPALAFSRADVQLLFTAPISRRRLVRYRILRSQMGVLWGSAIMTLLFRPGSAIDGAIAFIGLTVLMTTLNLHLTGVSLSRPNPGTPGESRRRWRVLQSIAALAILVVGATIAAHWPQLATAEGGGDLLGDIQRLSQSGAAGVILWPFRAVARLPLAESPAAFLSALPGALLLLALNYIWVLRTDVPFEEASAELSERIEDLRRRGLAALQKPRASVRTPFTLSLDGRPETAILWKNLIRMGRFLSWTLLLRVVPIMLVVGILITRPGRGGSAANMLTIVSLIVAGFALILGPQMVRSDLRQDLDSLDVLKIWPIRGASLVRGEILAPAIVLTVVVWLALLTATWLSTGSSLPPVPGRWSYLLSALLLAPGIILAQLLMQNALAVAFPAWVAVGAQQRGVDVMGQRLLMMAGMLLALVAAILPAAIVAGLVALVSYAIVGVIPVTLAAIFAAATLLVESFVGSEALGALLERTDVSAVDAPDT